MIKQVHSGKGITIINNHNSYPYISPGSNGAGMVRWNGSSNCFEVNDGAVWRPITMSDPTIELSSKVMLVIDWAEKKMIQEQELNDLAAKSESVKLAIQHLNTVIALSKEYK